jgi:hypothetical protein
VNIVETMADAELFVPWFTGSSWNSWRVALKGAYALPMTKAERNVFRTHSRPDLSRLLRSFRRVI